MNNIPNEIKEARKARSCKGDDCDQNHCPKCGSHTLGWLDTFQRCSSCEQEQKFMDEAKEIRDGDIDRGWPGDGSGTDDLADYNANEADDYRDE